MAGLNGDACVAVHGADRGGRGLFFLFGLGPFFGFFHESLGAGDRLRQGLRRRSQGQPSQKTCHYRPGQYRSQNGSLNHKMMYHSQFPPVFRILNAFYLV